MSVETIVLCFPVEPQQVQQIQENCRNRRIIVSTQDDIPNDILDADIFCGHSKKTPIDWAKVVQQGRLKWIQSSAAGLDHCLSDEITESDIVVSGCSGLFARQVAEQTAALAFGLVRRLPTFFRAQQDKCFVRQPTDELQGKNIGIVGLGGNGQRIAQTLRLFTQTVIATDVFPDSGSELVDELHSPDGLDHLLEQSDIVIVTLPQTAANEQLIGAKQLAAMKQGSYLINVGRGSVVDTFALTESLATGHLAGAGLDVCDPEPLPSDSPLWDMENVIITPHVAAQSKTRVPMTIQLFCENLRRYDERQDLLNLVDKRLGFPRPEYRLRLEDIGI